jgi:hypothetical protein
VNHGLGRVPGVILMSASPVATQIPSTSAVAISPDLAPTSSAFTFRANIADNGVTNNGIGYWWLVIG